MPKELVTAPLIVIETVIAKAIVPCVRELEDDLACELPLVVTQWLPHLQGPSVLVGATEPPREGASPPQTGQMRLSFRKNYGGDRYLFHAQAMYPRGFTVHPKFSGFLIEGGVQMEGDTPVKVQADGWTVLWGDSTDFKKWY